MRMRASEFATKKEARSVPSLFFLYVFKHFLLEVTYGVVHGLALILTVEQQREVVGTKP